MIFLIYASKTVIISALLYSYYWLFLRNKQFHQYNRFFLLGIPCIALILPLMNIPFPWHYWGSAGHGATRLLQVTQGQWEEAVIVRPGAHQVGGNLNIVTFLTIIYFALVLALLIVFLRSALYIFRISKTYSYQKMGRTRFYETDEKGTPFSFFNLVFWNRSIDAQSQKGQQILRHELYHVKQQHSFDIVFLEFLNIFCWFNPFFHWIRKEINAIHEFLADQYAISGCNKYAYAEILLLSSIQQEHPRISNPFFHNQIKRRITMITKNQSVRKNYLRRMMILPILFILSLVFAFRFVPKPSFDSKKIIAIIDAGHGGSDMGAVGLNGIDEKSINLKIAKKIKALSANYPVEVILTRESDELAGKTTDVHESLKYRSSLAAKMHADIFISIHVNADEKDPSKKGFDIYVADENSNPKSVLLASVLAENLKKEYEMPGDLKKSNKITVLNSNSVPAVLVECGFLTNANDASLIATDEVQEKIANRLLEGIAKYSQSNIGYLQGKFYENKKESGLGMQPESESRSDLYEEDMDGGKKLATVPLVPPVHKEQSEKVFSKVEIEAEFPGGQDAWKQYLNSHLVYPQKAIEKEIMGDVVVEFVVDKSGNVSHVKALSGPQELRTESVRIIKESGKWTPAIQDGQKVNAYRKQPIKYRLERQ